MGGQADRRDRCGPPRWCWRPPGSLRARCAGPAAASASSPILPTATSAGSIRPGFRRRGTGRWPCCRNWAGAVITGAPFVAGSAAGGPGADHPARLENNGPARCRNPVGDGGGKPGAARLRENFDGGRRRRLAAARFPRRPRARSRPDRGGRAAPRARRRAGARRDRLAAGKRSRPGPRPPPAPAPPPGRRGAGTNV